jgi:hypothetical protein
MIVNLIQMKKLIGLALCLLAFLMSNAQVANRFDVVIHEVFPDPSPPMSLPTSEFIELRNVSTSAFNLRNWKISDGSSTATITTNYSLQPDSIIVICASASAQAFSLFGATIGVTNFPSLNNDADLLTLISPEGKVIHFVPYQLSWYDNAVKSDGGWTLEMVDAHNACSGAGNWIASRDAKGGTPGKRNSVEASNPDRAPPGLLRTYAPNSNTIVAVFDESLDSGSAATAGNYKLDKGVTITKATPLGPPFNEVQLKVTLLQPQTVYSLSVINISDCAGNSIGTLNTAKAGFPSEADATDIIINEILFNPKPPGTDYVEFYNRSGKILDASALSIGNRNITGAITSLKKLSEALFLIFPSDYIIITEDAKLLQQQYTVKHPEEILLIDPMPSLPDDKGTIVLMNQQGKIADEVSYDEKWHFPLITNREGVALERIDSEQPSQATRNWTSAATDVGYGTPTWRNSQYRTIQALQGKVEVRPPVISPDNDGFDDVCFIEYELNEPNHVAAIIIYDLNGNVARNLVRNATISAKGFFWWDGLDDKNHRLPTGVYIVVMQLFTLDGKKKNFKNIVTIARGF